MTQTTTISLPADAEQLLSECHAAAVRGGWWHDIATGTEKLDRNKGELLCLAHSELSEGFEADADNSRDDKLTHRNGAEVELADAVIRLADYAGGQGWTVDINDYNTDDFRSLDWSALHALVSRVMEAERKNSGHAQVWLNKTIAGAVVYAQMRGFKLWDAISEKLAYNAQRADHKPENRRQAGGKKF